MIAALKLDRLTCARTVLARRTTVLRRFSTSARLIRSSASVRMRARPGLSLETNGRPPRSNNFESVGERSIRAASFVTYAAMRALRVTTTRRTWANGFATRARAIAFDTFGAASAFGSALNIRARNRSGSGDSNHEWRASAASRGSKPPTGIPPTVTPSGSLCDGTVVVVVVVVVVVATVVVVGV